jgi:hypothetical protein
MGQNQPMRFFSAGLTMVWLGWASFAAASPEAVNAGQVRALEGPSGANAAFPQLASDRRDGVFMTWIETLGEGGGHRLRLSHRKAGGAWEEPSTVHEGKDFWRNWADFPSPGVFADGSVMVHWLARSREATYDYNIKARISKDAGRTWGEPFLVNTDGAKAEHGFVSFAATEKGMAVVWLDGRETKGMSHEGEHGSGSGAMTLRFAEFSSDGTRLRESRLDARVCDCCQTTLVNTSKGLLAAYRDRSESEFRDISLVRPMADKVSTRTLSNDGWKINACPVNGPALASSGDSVAATWFTMAGGKARVKAALSRDGGDRFSSPVEVDGASPLGRVDVAVLPSGVSILSWLGRATEGVAEIKAAFLEANGVLKPAFTVANTSSARASGFPRLEPSGDEVVFAWTQVLTAPEGSTGPPPSRIRTAVMSVK